MLLREIAILELDSSIITDIANEIELGYKGHKQSGSKHEDHPDAAPIDPKYKHKIEKFVLDDSTVTVPELKDLIDESSKTEISAMISKVQSNAALIRREFIIQANTKKPIMEVLKLHSFTSAEAFNLKIEAGYATSYPALEPKIVARLTERSGGIILLNLSDPGSAKNSVFNSVRAVSEKADAELATVPDKTKIADLTAATQPSYADIVEFMFVYLTIEKRCEAIQDALAILESTT